MSYLEKRNQIHSLQKKIESHGELNFEVKKKINYKFRLDWNYYSNSMEGNTLSMDETKSVMIGNLTVGGKPIKDVLEMKGHNEIITKIIQMGKGEVRLSEARIREIHKGIMHEEDDERKKKIGDWKKENNHVLNYKGERFDFADWQDVPDKIHELLNKTNAAIDAIRLNKKNAPHPIDVALQFHLDYVIIHPFYDGNGRTARILTNLLLISFGFPPFWVKTNERSIYNQYIADIQGYSGDRDLFFEFAADKILRSQQIILDAIDGKNISGEDDFEKEIEILKRMQSPPRVKIKKSKATIQKALSEVYFPLLQSLDSNLVKMNKLFKAHSWTYFEEPQPPKYDIPIIPSLGSLNNILKYFYSISELNNSSYHQFKAAYCLIEYDDKNDFSIEISLKIYFHETDFSIQVFIGKPLLSGTIIKAVSEALKTIMNSNETPLDSFKNYDLFKMDYDMMISKEQIDGFSNQIRNEALAYIKQKINGKESE